MKIGVYGSALGGVSDEAKVLARRVGRYIALRGHDLITGACPGLPYEASSAAYQIKDRKGKIIGFSPGLNLQDHAERFKFPSEIFDELRFIPHDYPYKDIKGSCLKSRNVFSVSECDAAVIIAGRMGSANEFTIAYDLGKVIGILIGTGGFADEVLELVQKLGKATTSVQIYEPNPETLIEKIEAEVATRLKI